MTDWAARHPVLSGTIVIGGGILGGAAGILIAWLCVVTHLLSPDNVLAGIGLGTACAIMGLVSGGLITEEISKREKRQ